MEFAIFAFKPYRTASLV